MSTHTQPLFRSASARIDAWTLLTGASAAIVAGFAIDLVRLGVHETRRALASSGGVRRRQCTSLRLKEAVRPAPARAPSANTARRARKADAPAAALELRDACIVAARGCIAEHGIEKLSLRDVARQLGVSHQAPYKHYPSRDHLLAEVVRRCFEGFAAHLDAREHFDDPRHDLDSLGRQYIDYARSHPLEYRLMFNTPWPAAAEHPALLRDAGHAFDILRGVLRRLHGAQASKRELVDLDALFIWSQIHGLVGVTSGNCIDKLGLSAKVMDKAVSHVIDRMHLGLGCKG